MNRYWAAEDSADMERAATYDGLSLVAGRVLHRMPQPVGQVCGPITTGGQGSIEENTRVLKGYISRLVDEGETIFDQTPFQDPMLRILNGPNNRHKDHLLEAFYLPLFEERLVRILYFIPGWRTSYGTLWEHGQARRLGMGIVYLTGLPAE